jgi:amidohydrolase
MKRLLAMTAALCALASFAPARAEESLKDSIAADYKAHLWPLFEQLHRNPELSGREFETAKRLAAELKSLGYEVTTGVGGTGVVAVMKNGPGPTVLLRADMDGLPVLEQTGLPYASKVRQVDLDGKEQPVMHACGHDVHVTAMVGTARQLANRKGDWSGTLVLIGQPAEERIRGARDMLKDGLYTRFPKPDYALAFHVGAGVPAGKFEVPERSVMSSADGVHITVHGVGAHGASPHKGVDPVLVAAQIVVSLQSVVSRTIAPREPAVITVGMIHGGTKNNIIGDRVDMDLTIRADDFAVRQQLIDGVRRVSKGTALALGVPEDKLPEVTVSETETTPPTVNDPQTARKIDAAFRAHFGADRMTQQPRDGMGAEDFAVLVTPDTGVKGVYFSVGGTPEAELKTAPSHHSPLFKIVPEASITAGAEAMAVGAMTLMPKGGR